jgi:hypothetical protein
MARLNHPFLKWRPFPKTKWTVEDKPTLIVDGILHRLSSLALPLSGEAAYVVGINDACMPRLAEFLGVEFLHFYEMRVTDLSALANIKRLRHLKIHWNTKMSELGEIGALVQLETLVLENTPKIYDLQPLARLAALKALEISGGHRCSNDANHARSLEPLADLNELEELSLANFKVDEGGLRPIAMCRSLRTLFLSNQFDTEDYAFLSVALPKVSCEKFAPWTRVELSNGADTMITGKRKPFLNSKIDAAKITAYEEAFRSLQQRFSGDVARP